METPNPAPVFKSETPTSMFDDDELDKVLREKAKLEGQLEMLEIEARAAIRDRAELQTQLASLQTQLKSRASYDNMKGDRDLQSELDTMRKNRTNLELAIMDAHKVIGDKMEEIKAAQEEVQIAQNANDKLNDKIRELRDETKSKDSTMQDLKSKIAELYVEVQTSNQARTQAENENRSMKSDLDSLMKSKEWYLAQLQFTQEARSQLQGDITSVQVTSVSQSNQIERLKTENSELQQELAEVQQKAISEKEALARHLEAIEADMMEREAGFKEMQYNQVVSEQALKRKMLAMEEERTKLSHVNERILELEHDLQKAKNELRQKEATIGVFEREQAELMKRLTLSSENITQREHSLDSLEQRTIDFEMKIKTLQKDLNIRDEEVMILKQEKSTIAMMLASAQEEKKTFDEALHTLKEDMLKVEQSFKQMRQDLNERNEELNMVKHERDQLQHVLDNTKVEVEQKVKSYESQNVEFSEKTKALDELRINKVNLEGEIGKLKIDLEIAKTAQDSLTRENTSLEKELLSFKSKYEDNESTLNVTLAEKARLEGQIEMLTSEQEKLRVMAEENEVLRSKVGNLETVSHKDVALQKAKILKLGAEIKSITKESKEKCQEYEMKLANLDGKLSVAMETKTQNEAEILQLKKRLESESDEKVQHVNQKLETTESELETTLIQKQTLEHKIHEIEIRTLREIEEYRIKVKTLEKQMVTTRESEKQKLTEKMKKKMALELEREKGRLAGVMQSHSALKQHTSLLEQALAKREGTLVELDSVAQSEMRDKNKLESLYRGRITELESILEKERMSSKDVQKQLMVQRGNNTKYRKEVESLKLDVEQLNKDLESCKSQLELQQTDKEKDTQVELQYKTESERLNRELQAMKIEIDRLRYDISEGETRNPLVQQQIQQLEWQVKQKGEEHVALKKQMRLMEKRQQVELKNMKKTVEARNKEIEHLRHELAVSRKEKFDYQSKLAELRGTLKAHKAQPIDVTGGSLGLPEVAPLDTEAIEKLLSDTEKQKVDISKPLNVLQTCLTSLRSEISSLQQHVEGHTIAVQSSTHSWNQVEDHVKELRTISTPSDDSARSRSASPFDDVTMEPLTSEDKAISVSSSNEGSSQLDQPGDNTM
ncbi:unnamed protein product [Owenia fusiformis]|nr:unnamed protein product [Owenia fusiformis]